jgi:hypothetical protein
MLFDIRKSAWQPAVLPNVERDFRRGWQTTSPESMLISPILPILPAPQISTSVRDSPRQTPL